MEHGEEEEGEICDGIDKFCKVWRNGIVFLAPINRGGYRSPESHITISVRWSVLELKRQLHGVITFRPGFPDLYIYMDLGKIITPEEVSVERVRVCEKCEGKN